MNTEIFDYFKKISKREYFFLNFINTCLSIIVIIAGVISLINGAGVMLYTIMFGCATIVLMLNAYKFLKRGSKNGWFLILFGLIMCVFTVIGIMAMLNS